MTSVEGWGGYNWTQRSEQNATTFPFNNYFTFGLTVAAGHTISLMEINEMYRRDSAAPVLVSHRESSPWCSHCFCHALR
jgi:hypothetical protein